MKKLNLRNLTVKVIVLGAMLTVLHAQADRERLLWQDIVDVSDFDQAFDVDAVGNRVFAAGFVGFPLGSLDFRDFLIRAYDAQDGTLLWQDRVNKGSSDYAAAVLAEGRRVFVSGAVGPSCCPDWLVRAYDADRGRLLWEDRFDKSGTADRPRPCSGDL